MRLDQLGLVAILLATGCATPIPQSAPQPVRSWPANALLTQRAVLTARGRQWAMNGYLTLSETGGMRLVVMEMFGQVLADVLVKPDSTVHVLRSGAMFRTAWIQRYVAADLVCLFGRGTAPCPVRTLDATHFIIDRRWYSLDVRVVDIKPGPQSPELFEANP